MRAVPGMVGPMELGPRGALHGRSGTGTLQEGHVPASALCCIGLRPQVQLSALHFQRRTCCAAFL